MDRLTGEEVSRRANVSVEFFATLLDQQVIEPGPDGMFTPGDARRADLVRSLVDTGIGVPELAKLFRDGGLSLNFLDMPAYERFAAVSAETFSDVAKRTGVPIELLLVIREAFGRAEPSPDDRMREDELRVVPFLDLQVENGFSIPGIERLMRATGDALRRVSDS